MPCGLWVQRTESNRHIPVHETGELPVLYSAVSPPEALPAVQLDGIMEDGFKMATTDNHGPDIRIRTCLTRL